MAEAHQAVAFQFAVSDEGIQFHIDRGAVKASLKAIWRTFMSRCYGTLRTIHKGVFPATPLSLIIVSCGIFSMYTIGWFNPTLGLLPNNVSSVVSVSLLFAESLFLWTILSRLQQYTLKFLLFYKGWMFEGRGPRSWKTKLFAVSVKFVAGTSNPILGSYQRSLPRLPLPSINDTCNRYLDSVRPLYNDEEFEAKKALVEEFKRGPANQLQRYLILKSWISSNYVTDWWEKYVYQGWRGSVMINSNYFACDHLGVLVNANRIPRAAMYIYGAMRLKSEIENETLKPLIINNLIPLCSSQYKRLFGTCRIPGETEDHLFHASPEESRHVVCYRRGRWYKIQLYFKNKLLKPVDIQWQLQQIFDDDSDTKVSPGEEHLASLTSAERPFWAEVREKFFSTGVNKKYMEDIEKSAFVVNLDDGNPNLSLCGDNVSELLSQYCLELLHGNGYKFWFDKSFSTIFYASARMGINAEHSWADAPIIGHMLEYVCNMEQRRAAEIYLPDGTCSGELNKLTPKPQRMKWELSEACEEKIDIAYTNAKLAVEDIDLCCIQHDSFGKGIIKRCGISPDAFIQMALQLAHYKDAGSFCLTYEASMTRLYREGRTETVRSCTVEAADFVKAMCDPTNYTREDCKKLLKKATDRHVLAYKNAMIGKGIDRHLFCLYVVSRGKNISSPFLSSVIKEPWKLSTSQTPTQQTGRVDFHSNPDKISCGGGFGPVTKDGYGVSYIIPGDFVLYFHVSSFKSSPHTDSKRFASTIQNCLLDMIKLFDIVVKPEDGLQYKPPSSSSSSV